MAGILNAHSTSGGVGDEIITPLAETHPIDNSEDVEEAVAYAIEALNAAEKLESSIDGLETTDPLSNRLMSAAIENYIERFEIPRAALEDHPALPYSGTPSEPQKKTVPEDDDEDKPQASRLKKVILYLYAIVERIFKAIFDILRSQKTSARRLMPIAKQYIGESDGLSASIAGQMNVKDRLIMAALHIDGAVPKKVPELYDMLADTFEKQHVFVGVNEVMRLVGAAREKDEARVLTAAQELRFKLEAGFIAGMELVNDKEIPVISEKRSEAAQYYASEPMFGQSYIVGVIAKEINSSGTFRYSCGIRRDSEVPVRAPFFPVLRPDEIRHICRTTLRICENIIRFGHDEDLLQKALRDAAFLKTKESDKGSVVALRNIAAVGQNSYIVHLRYTMQTMQALMRWCGESIKLYNEMKQNGR